MGRLSWQPAPGATAYAVFRATADTRPYAFVGRVAAGGGGTLAFLDPTAPAEPSVYRVAALHACTTAGETGCDVASPVFDPTYATPALTVTRPQLVAPGSPAAFLAAPASPTAAADDGHVTISWAAVPGASTYRVYRGAAGANTALVATTSQVSWIDTGGTAGLSYTYTVAAVGSDGTEGHQSVPVTVTWIGAGSQPLVVAASPDDGATLGGTVVFQVEGRTGDGTGTVQWQLDGPRGSAAPGSATGRSTPQDPLTWRAMRSWDSTQVPDGTYVLTATLTDGAGDHAQVSRRYRVQNAGPPQPTGFAAALTANGVALSWQQPSNVDAALYPVSYTHLTLPTKA